MVNLTVDVKTTKAGLYTVTFCYTQAPLDIQEASFAADGLKIVSPAQLGFLRAKVKDGEFNMYSRTDADVFYDDRTPQAVIVPKGAMRNLVGIASLVDAHRQGKECVVPKGQRELAYALIDEMLGNGIAFTAPYGRTDVQTSDFGQHDVTSRLFTDKSLGIKAQDYGDFLAKQERKVQSLFFDDKAYALSQEAPYINGLRVWGPDYSFNVIGDRRNLGSGSGAFGVRFEKGRRRRHEK